MLTLTGRSVVLKIKIAYANGNADESKKAQSLTEYIRSHYKVKRIKTPPDKGATHKHIYIEISER